VRAAAVQARLAEVRDRLGWHTEALAQKLTKHEVCGDVAQAIIGLHQCRRTAALLNIKQGQIELRLVHVGHPQRPET
jgi:hypothetical protein